MKIACIQMRSGIREARNLSDLRELVAQAASGGARYVQTPEMTGLLQRDGAGLMAEISPDADNPVMAACSELAARHGLWLHLGSTAVSVEGGKAANRAALFSPSGKRVATYDKIHMFDVAVSEAETWRESSRYEPGTRTVVANIGELMIGMAICYDLRFPALFQAQAKAGAGLLSVPAAFTRPTGEAHWESLLRARAIENGAYVAAAAQGGRHEDGRSTHGHSMIVDPWGVVVARLDHDEPGVLIGEIDPSRIEEARRRVPNLANARKFAIEVIEADDEDKAAGAAGQSRGVA